MCFSRVVDAGVLTRWDGATGNNKHTTWAWQTHLLWVVKDDLKRFYVTNCSWSAGANRTFLGCLCRNMSGMQPLQISPRLSFPLGVCILGRKLCSAVPGPEHRQNKLPIENHGAAWPAKDVFTFWFGRLSLWTPVVFLSRLTKYETGDLDHAGYKYLFSKILSGKWKRDCVLVAELSTRGH